MTIPPLHEFTQPAQGLRIRFSNGQSGRMLFIEAFPIHSTDLYVIKSVRFKDGSRKTLCLVVSAYRPGVFRLVLERHPKPSPMQAVFDGSGVLRTPGYSGILRITSIRNHTLTDDAPYKHQRLWLQGPAPYHGMPTPCQFPAASS